MMYTTGMRGNERGKREKRIKEHGESPRNKKVGTRSDASAGASACEKLTISGDVPRLVGFCPMEESLPPQSVDVWLTDGRHLRHLCSRCIQAVGHAHNDVAEQKAPFVRDTVAC
jgi:hypothetical protein